MTAIEPVDRKIVEKFANELSARMLGFLKINVLVDAQLSLVVPAMAGDIHSEPHMLTR